jgi:Nitrogenase molybdenum-iron protein, alpha and beta chains
MTTLKSTLKEETRKIVTEVLETYPEKAQKKRAKHLNVYDEGKADCGVKSNIKSIPGVMTTRGCAYAGSKGVVWGPVKDMIHLSHGPVGCGYYSWSGRRNYYVGITGVNTFGTMQFTSDFQERDVVFGGDKKLAKLLVEASELFPLAKGITIQSECPVGYPGGTPLEAAAQRYTTPKTLEFLAEASGRPTLTARPVGIRGTDEFLMQLSQLTGKPIPAELEIERGRAVDAFTDSQAWIHGKRVALYGDPDLVMGLLSLLLELGAEPIHVVVTNSNEEFEAEARTLLASSPYGQGATVWGARISGICAL